MTGQWGHRAQSKQAQMHTHENATYTLFNQKRNSLAGFTDGQHMLCCVVLVGVVAVGLLLTLLLTAIKTQQDWALALKKE